MASSIQQASPGTMWARPGTEAEPEPGVEGDSVTFVLHETKETFSHQNAVIKLEREECLGDRALITLGSCRPAGKGGTGA